MLLTWLLLIWLINSCAVHVSPKEQRIEFYSNQFLFFCFFKVSGNLCDDHNLSSVGWKKKRFYNFFFISLYKYRLETINWFMNNSLSILLCGVKFALHLVHFMINFELQLQEATKFFSYFDFGLLEWRIVKNHARDFWLRFYFLRYWPILVSFEMSTINRKFFIT